ncbi:DEAD/DEAH box helicase [Telluribacter sp.]|jgi:superfamily II DNA or RNA helicase|uniref:DEAD/DEAH box helicase n=1 Tax=Telluribacter sp. TaxID=1978767 RepID=UPI002E1367C1|nr:DEAD/DEAH box helicase [Telluribacter sp.]
MKVSTAEPFQIIYSLLEHEFLGYIFESFVVQLDGRGNLTLLIQNISSKNVNEFADSLDAIDVELVRLIDDIQQDVILKKFNSRKLSPVDFFLKVYDSQKGDKLIQEAIAGYLENMKARILAKLAGKEIYIMGSDGNPAWKHIAWRPEKATVRFHFERTDFNTLYYPTIKYGGQRVDFQNKGAMIICDEPAWLVVDDGLYHFAGNVDGKKLRPFLTKKSIFIPRKVEDQYFRRFVTALIASYDVVAEGEQKFEIRNEALSPLPLLTLSETYSNKPSAPVPVLFGDDDLGPDEDSDEEGDVVFDLSFQYGQFSFRFDSFANNSNVELEKKGEEYIFHKVRRDLTTERQRINQLKDWGLDLRNGRYVMPKSKAFGWLQSRALELAEQGITIRQSTTDTKRYFLGYSSLDVSITEGRDWFDIYARVCFGEFEIPFIKLRQYILHRKREFALPNGEIAVIPEWWFTRYSELFSYVEHNTESDGLLLRKHHLVLVQELQKESLAEAIISRRLESLRNFEEIEEYRAPIGFKGLLRPYQKAGYDWLRFLNQYRFGGCLADDMGLGKTIQTLAMLQSQKEAGVQEPTLLVMPTSLLYNWALEAQRFTPALRTFMYTGTYRDKNTEQFKEYDLILTSYGIVRLDVDLLKAFRFHYVILDESQAIKNPSSHITKAVMQLNSAHRLILTGTPLENSTMDLWTQMTFVNPGLLGSQTFFRNEYQVPIEKRNDEEKTQRLYNLIKPFILRRHKSQVATDLPEKVESIQYCEMSGDQEKKYEEAKSYYRNLILQSIDKDGMARSQMMVLQGLTKLRQLANHPQMVDETYESNSGKFEDVLHKLETAISENHKILVFSQFVKHLDLFRKYLDQKHIPYAYLDGSTKFRQTQVEEFQNDKSIKVFLISLKAGGLGLNLTAADYVFILDPWWNPAIEAQAVDRAHRIGQDRTVFTYKFITKNSVEEKILALQRSKRQLADDLISNEDGFIKSLTREDVLALLD